MSDIGAEPTVAFLLTPEAYPEPPPRVEAIETHMSWVFLTDRYAYKLKKSSRHDTVDLSTPELRRRNCQEEVRLSRQLAPAVYLGVVALTRAPDGTLALEAGGEPVDWLVHMQRLPADRMLDAIIARGRAEETEVRAVAHRLASFYARARPEPISGPAFRELLAEGVGRDLRELSRPEFGLPRDRVELLARTQLRFLTERASLFDRRVEAHRIVEGHGDLRPEHVCLIPEPVIIDRLEFARTLRMLDPADELAFFGLECERLGQPRIGRWFLETYTQVTGDAPPEPLLRFYRVYRALRRATIAVWHLTDRSVGNPARFAAKARRYLELVEPV